MSDGKRLKQYYEGLAAFTKPECKNGHWHQAQNPYDTKVLVGKEWAAGFDAAYLEQQKEAM